MPSCWNVPPMPDLFPKSTVTCRIEFWWKKCLRLRRNHANSEYFFGNKSFATRVSAIRQVRTWSLMKSILAHCIFQNFWVEINHGDCYWTTTFSNSRVASTICICLTLYGAGCVFIVLIAMTMQSLIRQAGFEMTLCHWMVIVALVLIPLTWMGTPKDFWWVNPEKILTLWNDSMRP